MFRSNFFSFKFTEQSIIAHIHDLSEKQKYAAQIVTILNSNKAITLTSFDPIPKSIITSLLISASKNQFSELLMRCNGFCENHIQENYGNASDIKTHLELLICTKLLTDKWPPLQLAYHQVFNMLETIECASNGKISFIYSNSKIDGGSDLFNAAISIRASKLAAKAADENNINEHIQELTQVALETFNQDWIKIIYKNLTDPICKDQLKVDVAFKCTQKLLEQMLEHEEPAFVSVMQKLTFLIINKADVNACDKDGWNPLRLVVMQHIQNKWPPNTVRVAANFLHNHGAELSLKGNALLKERTKFQSIESLLESLKDTSNESYINFPKI